MRDQVGTPEQKASTFRSAVRSRAEQATSISVLCNPLPPTYQLSTSLLTIYTPSFP
jgi:hypothetical protein